MKRYPLSLLMSCFLIPLFSETNYYRSDWVGLAMEPIAVVRMDEFEYVLGVNRSGSKTIKTLFRKQKEWKRWEIITNEQRLKTEEWEYENNRLTVHSTFARKGRMRPEERF